MDLFVQEGSNLTWCHIWQYLPKWYTWAKHWDWCGLPVTTILQGPLSSSRVWSHCNWDFYPGERDKLRFTRNEITVYHHHFIINFTHDVSTRSTIIEVATAIKNIAKAWFQLITITNTTIRHTLDRWSGSTIEAVFYSLSSLSTERQSAYGERNSSNLVHSEYQQKVSNDYNLYRELDDDICGVDMDVPTPHKMPM